MRSWAGQHSEVVEDHHGVLDEHPVRELVGGLHLGDRPAVGSESLDVLLPLLPSPTGIDLGAGQVGQLPVRELG
jgi:hypothetical protein